MVLYEFLPLSMFDALGVLGVAMFVGFQALVHWRIMGGDGLAFFAGNTFAAALVLISNFGDVHPVWLPLQLAFIALAMLAMIARFFARPSRPRLGHLPWRKAPHRSRLEYAPDRGVPAHI